MEGFTILIMKPKLLVLLFPILIASGCNLINPIKMLSCEIKGDKEYITLYPKKEKFKETQKYIFNTNNGKNYGYNTFKEELELEDGTIEKEGLKANIKTVLIKNRWKRHTNIINPSLKVFNLAEIIEIDLTKMKIIKYENHFTLNSSYMTIEKGGGECKWKPIETLQSNNL